MIHPHARFFHMILLVATSHNASSFFMCTTTEKETLTVWELGRKRPAIYAKSWKVRALSQILVYAWPANAESNYCRCIRQS